MEKTVRGKDIKQWVEEFPVIGKLMAYEPVFWINEGLDRAGNVLPELPLNKEDIADAEKRLQRFAPLISKLFPETQENNGLIESQLIRIKEMKVELQSVYHQAFDGELMLKCDNYLPVAGSIKARGGIYEVLKHAEELALNN